MPDKYHQPSAFQGQFILGLWGQFGTTSEKALHEFTRTNTKIGDLFRGGSCDARGSLLFCRE